MFMRIAQPLAADIASRSIQSSSDGECGQRLIEHVKNSTMVRL
jgi:hypothetical protein